MFRLPENHSIHIPAPNCDYTCFTPESKLSANIVNDQFYNGKEKYQ